MKKHTRRLLIILPFLPLLMANSPAPQRKEYRDLEVTYLSVETFYSYNFYHFNVKNAGDCYVDYFYIENKPNDKSFYVSIDNDEINPPFNYLVLEPGFEKELVVATKNKIPESHEVQASSYSYYLPVDNITYTFSNEVTYSVNDSDVANNQYIYKLDAKYNGDPGDEFNYVSIINLTYVGVSFAVRCDSINKVYFQTSESIDLEKLTINDVKMVRYNEEYNYPNYFAGCQDFINAFLLFLLIFFILLSFGIFAAIFFPAMARRRRRKALLEQDKK